MNRQTVSLACCLMMLAFALGIGGDLGGTAIAVAEEHQLDLNAPDAIRQTLEQQLGKRVKVKLESGQDLEGKVAKVGSHAVQLSELSGMEFFDATVKLDEVAAVIVRVRTK